MKKFNLLIAVVFTFFLLSFTGLSIAGLRTDNVVDVDTSSITIQVVAPTVDEGSGVQKIIVVAREGETPDWAPADGVNYPGVAEAQAAADNAGANHFIAMEPSSNGRSHEIMIEDLEMGKRYLFKPWFQYTDSEGNIRYTSPQADFASEEFIRHQQSINHRIATIAKTMQELAAKENLPEASYTQAVLGIVMDDAEKELRAGVTEGIKTLVMKKVLKGLGDDALNAMSELNRGRVNTIIAKAAVVYDNGEPYENIDQSIDNSLDHDSNLALDLSEAAVTAVAPWSQPIFYVTEVAVEAYADTAGIKAEIMETKESLELMQNKLKDELEKHLQSAKTDTYYGFAVTNLGGVLDHPLELTPIDAPYLVSEDLIITRNNDYLPEPVTFSIPDAKGRITVLLEDGVNIRAGYFTRLNARHAIFNAKENTSWGAIIFESGSEGEIYAADLYNGGKNQPAQLIVRSNGEGNEGIDIDVDAHNGRSGGVLVDGVKAAVSFIYSENNQGPGLWLKNPAPESLVVIGELEHNHQGLMLEGESALDVTFQEQIRLSANQSPDRPAGSEDLVFMDVDYSDRIMNILAKHTSSALKPGLFLGGREVVEDGKTIRVFTIPAKAEFAVPEVNTPPTIRYTDVIRVNGTMTFPGSLIVYADSENTPGRIEVAGGTLTAQNTAFTYLDPSRSWDGMIFQSDAGGALEKVSFNGGGSGSLGAQLVLNSDNVSVKQSAFFNSSGIGVNVENSAPAFTENRISGAGKYGLYTVNADGFQPQKNIFARDNGDRESFSAVYAVSSSGSLLDAENNAWGDRSGPKNPDNPDGVGATAGALVDYDPWIGKAAEDVMPGDNDGGASGFKSDAMFALVNGGFYVNPDHRSEKLDIYGRFKTDPALQQGETSFVLMQTGSYPSFPRRSIYKVESSDFNTREHIGEKVFILRGASKAITDIYGARLYFQNRLLDREKMIVNWGDVTKTMTLKREGSPYVLAGIGKPSGMNGPYAPITVTIEPGVVVLIRELFHLYDNASLQASGAAFINNPSEVNMEYENAITDLGQIILDHDGTSAAWMSLHRGNNCDRFATIQNSFFYNTSVGAGSEFWWKLTGIRVELDNNSFYFAGTMNTRPDEVNIDSGFCPVIFSNNNIFNSIYLPNTDSPAYESGGCRITVGEKEMRIKDNIFHGGPGIQVFIGEDPGSSTEPVIISGNKLLYTHTGISISSSYPYEIVEGENGEYHEEQVQKQYDINRLQINNNYVRTIKSVTTGESGWKFTRPGLSIGHFSAFDNGMQIAASGNDFNDVAINSGMVSGAFTLTSALAEGLAGPQRIFLMDPYSVKGSCSSGSGSCQFVMVDESSFVIGKDASLTIAGTQEKPILLVFSGMEMPEPFLLSREIKSGIETEGEFNARHTVFTDIYDHKLPRNQKEAEGESWLVTEKGTGRAPFYWKGLHYMEESKGLLNSITVRRVKRWGNSDYYYPPIHSGVTVESGNVTVRNSRLEDNLNGLYLSSVSATVKDNMFIRDHYGIMLAHEIDYKFDQYYNSPSGTQPENYGIVYTANPVLDGNSFDACNVGYVIWAPAQGAVAITANRFTGDDNLTGIRVYGGSPPNNSYAGANGPVVATGLYWGAESGPLDSTNNPLGQGVKVETEYGGEITYDPWIGEHPSSGTIQFSTSTYSMEEGDDGVQIAVTRADGHTGSVSVSYSTVDATAVQGDDYIAAAGNLNWADGEDGFKYFFIPVIDDNDIEGTEMLDLYTPIKQLSPKIARFLAAVIFNRLFLLKVIFWACF